MIENNKFNFYSYSFAGFLYEGMVLFAVCECLVLFVVLVFGESSDNDHHGVDDEICLTE